MRNEELKEIEPTTKVVISIILLICIAFCVYYVLSSSGHIEEKFTFDNGMYTFERTIQYVNFQSIAQWVIVGSLAALLWLWRKKFGITGVAGIQGELPSVEPASYDNEVFEKDERIMRVENSHGVKLKFGKHQSDGRTDEIQKLLKKYSALSTSKISELTGWDKGIVKRTIMKNPQLFRKNGNGPNTVYTNAQSLENEAVDAFVKKFIDGEVVADTRPARIDGFVVDAVVQTNKEIYLFEIKEKIVSNQISNQIVALHHIAEKFKTLVAHIVVIILDAPENKDWYCHQKKDLLARFRTHPSDTQIYLKSEIEQ